MDIKEHKKAKLSVTILCGYPIVGFDLVGNLQSIGDIKRIFDGFKLQLLWGKSQM